MEKKKRGVLWQREKKKQVKRKELLFSFVMVEERRGREGKGGERRVEDG